MLLRRAVVTAVLASVVLAGCGAAEKLSPRVAVREAANATANQKEGTFRLSVVGSEADMNALFNEGAPLTDEDRKGLEALRGGHIAVSTAEDAFGLDVKAGSLEHVFEVRYIAGKLYARADVDGLARYFGFSTEEFDQTVAGLSGQPGFEFLAAAADGKWITADLTTLKGLFDDLGKQFGGEAFEGLTPPTIDPKAATGQFQAIKDAVGKALTEDVSIKKLESDDVGDHYLGTVSSLRSFYAKVRPALAGSMGPVPFAQSLPAEGDIPDKPASLDVWIKGGRVNRLEFDLGQFIPAPPGTGRVALRLDIDREASAVTAPSDAVGVDIAGLLQNLFSQFGQFLGGLGEGLAEFD
ncbi:MAG TPA: hypothetical protein VFS16_04200 [Acidimicrobiia bacterium]|nr:hypothetical protein [Acidimicrobiia bacterium]